MNGVGECLTIAAIIPTLTTGGAYHDCVGCGCRTRHGKSAYFADEICLRCGCMRNGGRGKSAKDTRPMLTAGRNGKGSG